MSEWRPIETAPKDGTEFMAWLNLLTVNVFEPRCRFDPDSGAFQVWERIDYDMDGWESGYTASHWMPIPPPPLNRRTRDE
jgi:hypothetical protein